MIQSTSINKQTNSFSTHTPPFPSLSLISPRITRWWMEDDAKEELWFSLLTWRLKHSRLCTQVEITKFHFHFFFYFSFFRNCCKKMLSGRWCIILGGFFNGEISKNASARSARVKFYKKTTRNYVTKRRTGFSDGLKWVFSAGIWTIVIAILVIR